MRLDVCFTPQSLTPESLKGTVVVVVDVLRACSTIVTALHNGARAVVPVADMAEAGRIAAALDPETSLLGGERGGQTIDGYAAGNSPLEYGRDVAEGKTIVLNSSNGTGAFVQARSAERVVAGCFLNVSRVVDFLRQALPAHGDSPEGLILCAGHEGRLALEDVLCAGMILDRLWEGATPDLLSDSAHIALTQYRHDRHRLARALFGCAHTQRLIALGFSDDVAYCAQLDALPVLPRYRDSRLILEGVEAPTVPLASDAGAKHVEAGA